MAKLPNPKQAASGVGFLGIAAVVNMHKAVCIAERARHKPDKAAHERVMIWVDNVRKVAVPNVTLQKHFPDTYDIWLPSGKIRDRHQASGAART